ncbi:MAG: AI-2E family transporter [Candidatus Margulisiibacteriota bacterium]
MSRKQAIKLGSFILFVIAIYLVRGALLPIVLSIALFYILNPLANLFAGIIPKRMPARRDIAICGAFAIFIVVVILAYEHIVPQIISQFTSLVSNFPGYFTYVTESISSSRKWYLGANLPQQVDTAVLDALKQALGLIVAFSQNMIANLIGMLGQFIGLVAIPVVSYFMLREQNSLFEGADRLLPQTLKGPVRNIFEKTDVILKHYVESQFIICSLAGLLTWAILYFLGVPLSLILGIIVAITQLIPVIGPLIGGIPAVVIAATVSPVTALYVIILYGTLQFIAGYIIAPKIMGDKLEIHPLTVILGVLILGNIIGVWGVFFAAPIIAILKVIYVEIKKV